MYTRTTRILKSQEPKYLEELKAEKEKLLFFDIETTGLKADASSIYLIGCCFFENECWQVVQWFADDYESEGEIISCFIKTAKKHPLLVQYNGEVFDITYLKKKALSYKMNFPEIIKQKESYESVKQEENEDVVNEKRIQKQKYFSIDLLLHFRHLKKLCCLKSLKLKEVEALFGIERKDPFSGGELLYAYSDYMKLKLLSVNKKASLPDFDRAKRYSDYSSEDFYSSLKNKSMDSLLEDMLLHNIEDVISLLSLFCVTRATELFFYPGLIWDMSRLSNHLYWEENKDKKLLHAEDIIIPAKKNLKVECIPGISIYLHPEGFELEAESIRTELKLFFPDYRNYYYLPLEDYALHKSIGEYIDRERRERAKPCTAYTRHENEYIPALYRKNAVSHNAKQHRAFPVLFTDYYSDYGYVRFSDVKKSENLIQYLKMLLNNTF